MSVCKKCGTEKKILKGSRGNEYVGCPKCKGEAGAGVAARAAGFQKKEPASPPAMPAPKPVAERTESPKDFFDWS
jgi:ssDNA-binding Zn-finger/Zn-ribbon topoisomerase 1